MPYGDNIFTGILDENGTIWEAGTGRKRQIIGVDTQREQELLGRISEIQERLDQYYNKLVEVGVITPPKSPEQIAQETAAQQTAINQALLDAVNSLKSEIRELKCGGTVGNGDELSDEPVRQDSKGSRKVAPRSKGRNATGDQDAPGDTE